MSLSPDQCCDPCAQVPPVNVPGPPGADGAAGAAGPNTVTAATTTNLTGYLKGDGANVSAQAVPIPLADGGTGAITKAAGQLAFGLGQDITEINGTALAYALIAPTPATIGGTMVVTVPATGLYLVVGWACVEFRGTTFAASRTVTLVSRNTTTNTDIGSAAKTTGTPTTTGYPSHDYQVPYKTANLTAGDVIALQIGIDIVQSAGTSEVTEASLAIIPLALA